MISFSIVRFHFEIIVLVRVEGRIFSEEKQTKQNASTQKQTQTLKYVDIDKQNQQSHHVNQQLVLRRCIWSGAIRNFSLGFHIVLYDFTPSGNNSFMTYGSHYY